MTMARFVVRRIIYSIILFFLVICVNFLIFRLMPGDPSLTVADPTSMTLEMRREMIHKFGLDKPLWDQFVVYITSTVRLDFGMSFVHRVPVTEVIFERRFMNTFILMGLALLISSILGTLLGVISGWKRKSTIDAVLLTTSILLYAIPAFWSGLIVLFIFSLKLRWIPLSGTQSYGTTMSSWAGIVDYLHHLIGPLTVITMVFLGSFYLIMRNSILDIFSEDYMVTAEAKGLKDRIILLRHAAKNAILPQISLLGVMTSMLISGAILTETVFSWNGLGKLLYHSALSLDYPVLQGIFFFLATIVIIANFIADILYSVIDPRIRY